MRLGLVQYLNARPLDYGFRQDALANRSFQLYPDTPANLYRQLLAGELDAALISSVECLRNRDRLGFCSQVGVCSEARVASILYLKQPQSSLSPDDFVRHPAPTILVDSGSRSSVALLSSLLLEQGSSLPQIIPTDPQLIVEQIDQDHDGLLIGDSALHFAADRRSEQFWIKDLAQWWHEQEGLPFVFALWAYPLEKILPDKLFVDSYLSGEAAIETIASQSSSSFPGALEYLQKNLHYRMGERELRSLQRFEQRLKQRQLL